MSKNPICTRSCDIISSYVVLNYCVPYHVHKYKHFLTTIFYYIDWTSIIYLLPSALSRQAEPKALLSEFAIGWWVAWETLNLNLWRMRVVWCCVCFFGWRNFVGVHPDPWGRWSPWAIWRIFTTESLSFCDKVIYFEIWYTLMTCLDITYVVFHIFEGCIVHTTTQCTYTQAAPKEEKKAGARTLWKWGWYPSTIPHDLGLRMFCSGSTQVSNVAYQVSLWWCCAYSHRAVSPSNPNSFPKPQVEADAGEGTELQLDTPGNEYSTWKYCLEDWKTLFLLEWLLGRCYISSMECTRHALI